MSRYSKRKQSLRRKNLLGSGLIVCVLSVFAFIVYFGYELSSQQGLYDPETLCPIEGRSSEYIALVFDKSDIYNPVQQAFLKRFFSNFKANLVPGTQVSLYVIEQQKNKVIKPSFVMCAPRTGKQANAYYENPKRIQQRWKYQFEQPLDQVIDAFMKPAQSDFSPILEVFQTIALSAFPIGSGSVNKKIIIVSDMLHHTKEWSHYRKQMDFSQLQKTDYYQRINTNLQGTDVNILYVRRDGKERLQNKRHAFFWADYIQSIGGRVTLIEKIDG